MFSEEKQSLKIKFPEKRNFLKVPDFPR